MENLNTSDLSGNESSEGSGLFRSNIISLKVPLLSSPLESPTQIGEDVSFGEPYMIRSAESKNRISMKFDACRTKLSVFRFIETRIVLFGSHRHLNVLRNEEEKRSCRQNEIIRFRCRRNFNGST